VHRLSSQNKVWHTKNFQVVVALPLHLKLNPKPGRERSNFQASSFATCLPVAPSSPQILHFFLRCSPVTILSYFYWKWAIFSAGERAPEMARCRSWWNCVKCILWVFTIEFAGTRSRKLPRETSFLKLVSGWLHCHWAEQRELYSRRKLNKFEWFHPSDIRTQSHSRLCIYTYIPRVQSSRPHIFPVSPLSLSLYVSWFSFFKQKLRLLRQPRCIRSFSSELQRGENWGKGPLLFKLLTLNPAKLSSHTQLPSGRD